MLEVGEFPILEKVYAMKVLTVDELEAAIAAAKASGALTGSSPVTFVIGDDGEYSPIAAGEVTVEPAATSEAYGVLEPSLYIHF